MANSNKAKLLSRLRKAREGAQEANNQRLIHDLDESIEALDEADDSVMKDRNFLQSLGDYLKNLWDWAWGTLKKCFRWVADLIKSALELVTSIIDDLADCFA